MDPAERAAPLRVLLYSHDSVGLGHIRRNLAQAHALSRDLPGLTGRPVTGLLATGTGLATTLDKPDGFDVVVLPGVAKGESGYQPRDVDVPMAELAQVREQMLAAVLSGFAPELVIVDRHPHGLNGELRSALADLRRERPQTVVVLGLREVLDDPRTAAREWRRLGNLRKLRRTFDEIWVFGDPRVHDVRRTGEVPPALRDMVRYTGYLSTGRPRLPEDDRALGPYILTMVGGGSDGAELCAAAARAAVPAGYCHLVVTGPQMPAWQRDRIEALAVPGTRVVAGVPDGMTTIRRAAAVVCMAGYNTTCEVMSTDIPALLVPRQVPRREQAIRAGSLARVGAVDVLAPADLTSTQLSAWLHGAVGRRVDRSGVDRAGLRTVPALAAALLTRDPEVVHAAV